MSGECDRCGEHGTECRCKDKCMKCDIEEKLYCANQYWPNIYLCRKCCMEYHDMVKKFFKEIKDRKA